MVTAQQLSRAIRVPGYRPPASGTPPPQPFVVAPSAIGRWAVYRYHDAGASAARAYIRASVVGQWTGHRNPSLAGNARNVMDGLNGYIMAAQRDGRRAIATNRSSVVSLPSGDVDARLDVVLIDGDAIAGRIVFWDGPDLGPGDAPLIAAVYSEAINQLYPGRSVTSIGVWQARRQTYEEVPFAAARAQLPNADAIRAGL